MQFPIQLGHGLNERGDDVTVQGRLVRALRDRFLGMGGEHGAIVFEDSRLVEFHGRRHAN